MTSVVGSLAPRQGQADLGTLYCMQGSLLLAVFFGCMLYSQELVLVLNHFRHRPADNPLQSAMLAVLFANDTFAMANEINMVYGYLISNWYAPAQSSPRSFSTATRSP